MPVQSRIRGFFLCVSVLALGLTGLGPVAWAQPLSLASDPAVMARVALGELKHGQAAVGTWRDGKSSEALVQAGDAAPAVALGSGAPPLFGKRVGNANFSILSEPASGKPLAGFAFRGL